jgi:hypothetical protein
MKKVDRGLRGLRRGGRGKGNIKNQNAKIQGKNQNVGKRESARMQGKRRVPCEARDDGREKVCEFAFFYS